MILEHGHPSRIGWQLPPFFCPFDASLHPKAQEIEQWATEWVDAFGIYPDATERAWGLATHSADFSCRIIPFGEVEHVLTFTLWNYWANAIDDWQDSGPVSASTVDITDHGARLARALEAPGSALLPPGPLTAALDDLVTRTRDLLTPFQLRRFTEGARDWLIGAGWRTANAERGTMPSLNDYAGLGALANGTRFSLTWADAANEIRLPPDDLYAAPVQALTDAAGFIVSADNDLFSYNKDDDQEPWEQNLVNVLAHERGCAPRDALAEAVGLRDRVMTLFVRLRAQLARGADEPLRRYLHALEDYIAGSIAWQNLAPRYASPRNRNELPVEGASFGIVWSDTPSVPGTEPPPVPALSWWWQQLER
ncbi:hypothetical protein AB0C96_14085 [Streptomyces sp. NPDC048506]|uniref:terpene synthase family protein n=1 Tax=Streptomyces sp. NPDC048506 TaxID=3155028 RepID=UPI00342EF3A9